MKKELLVRKIRQGIVIDHIPAGKGKILLRILGIDKLPHTWVLLSNVESKKIGKKDIIKVENFFPTVEHMQIIFLVAPEATLNYIEDYKVIKKVRSGPPEKIVNILKCPNPFCITNDEREKKFISSIFLRKDDGYVCKYCEYKIRRDEIEKSLISF